MIPIAGGVCRLPALHTMEWDGGELAGTVVVCRGATGHNLATIGEIGATVETPFPAVGLFVQNVDSWNLKHADGRSVPVTLDAFLGFDVPFIRALLVRWLGDVLAQPYPHQGMVEVEQATAEFEAPAEPPAVVEVDEVDPALLELARYQRVPLPGETPADVTEPVPA